MKGLVAFLGASLLASAVALAGAPLRGTFALQGATAKADGYLVDGQLGADPLARRFDMWLAPRGSTKPIASYVVDMTKLLHVLIVSDDFTFFAHEHPSLEPDGHFMLDSRLPKPGAYHVYADGEPQGYGQQVFRFDLQAGAPPAGGPAVRDLSERNATCLVDGYAVTLSTLQLKAGGESKVEVHIRRDGKPATDVHPYLTALAHAVFINASDLTYVHVHPLPLGSEDDDMAGMPGMRGMEGMSPPPSPTAGLPDMALHVNVLEPGTYKLWFQFAGGSSIHVAQFVLTAG